MVTEVEENIARGYPLPLWTTKVLNKGRQEFQDLVKCADCGTGCLVAADYMNIWPRDLNNPAAHPGVVVCEQDHNRRLAEGQVNNYPWAAYRAANKR